MNTTNQPYKRLGIYSQIKMTQEFYSITNKVFVTNHGGINKTIDKGKK